MQINNVSFGAKLKPKSNITEMMKNDPKQFDLDFAKNLRDTANVFERETKKIPGTLSIKNKHEHDKDSTCSAVKFTYINDDNDNNPVLEIDSLSLEEFTERVKNAPSELVEKLKSKLEKRIKENQDEQRRIEIFDSLA